MTRTPLSVFPLAPYGLLWRAARPFLRRHKRLRGDFPSRMVPASWALPWSGQTDIWIQAASGGEAYLARQLLEALLAMASLHPQQPLRILCTSCTRQGLDVLEAALRDGTSLGLDIAIRVFPLDEPAVMRRALDMVRPRAVALLETELWPGLMALCAANAVPVAVVNGRMTEKSWSGYRLLRGFWRQVAPRRILAMDDTDASRFADLFGFDRVGLMHNMKFDGIRLETAAADPHSPAARLLPGDVPVILLASVREEEESLLLPVIADLRKHAPETILVIAPRHMERVAAWNAHLSPYCPRLRSSLKDTDPARPGDAVIWDAFGELSSLYARANAVFVGGSLAPLGGQNFLEPAGQGRIPAIGPFWKNFAWVGEAFFAAGLGIRVTSPEALCSTLLAVLRTAPDPEFQRRQVAAYVAPRQGGTRQAAEEVLRILRRR